MTAMHYCKKIKFNWMLTMPFPYSMPLIHIWYIFHLIWPRQLLERVGDDPISFITYAVYLSKSPRYLPYLHFYSHNSEIQWLDKHKWVALTTFKVDLPTASTNHNHSELEMLKLNS
jgi:hypothetical protein